MLFKTIVFAFGLFATIVPVFFAFGLIPAVATWLVGLAVLVCLWSLNR